MTVVVTPTPTEIVPYKIPTGIIYYVLANRYTGEGHTGEAPAIFITIMFFI